MAQQPPIQLYDRALIEKDLVSGQQQVDGKKAAAAPAPEAWQQNDANNVSLEHFLLPLIVPRSTAFIIARSVLVNLFQQI